MSNYKYVGLFLVVIVFGIYFVPKIINRISDNIVVQDGRSKSADPLKYIMLNGDAKIIPDFTFFLPENKTITME